jgi:hypothetical protein
MEEFKKMDALKYLVKIGPEYTNEWTEAGMYNILCKVINSDEEIFTKNILDELLKEATNY